ncbi:MAG: cytidylate kinase family protein [Aigarchaeota archaeon]|nr:cytidylate kinase family protein [Candidatus Calditenuis fumarioli]
MGSRRERLLVLISGQAATGKSTLGRALARRLGIPYYSGGDALMRLARKMGFNAKGRKWWDTEEGMRFLRMREENFEFDRKVDEELIQIAREGPAVIDGWVIPWLVQDGFKIWLKAELETRARRLAKRGRFAYEEALRVLTEREARNRELYQRLYGIRWGEDLSPFHLVLDSTRLGKEEVLRLVLTAVRYYFDV